MKTLKECPFRGGNVGQPGWNQCLKVTDGVAVCATSLDYKACNYFDLRKEKFSLDKKAISAIESVLAKGDRAEVIPVKDGVKVLRVRREDATHDIIRKGG